jgi:hypothetical protein
MNQLYVAGAALVIGTSSKIDAYFRATCKKAVVLPPHWQMQKTSLFDKREVFIPAAGSRKINYFKFSSRFSSWACSSAGSLSPNLA